MKKKIIAVFISAILMTLSIPQVGVWASPSPDSKVTYDQLAQKAVGAIDRNGVEIVGYTGSFETTPVQDVEKLFTGVEAANMVTEAINSGALGESLQGGRLAVKDAAVLGIVDIKGSTTLSAGSVIKLPVSGVHAGDRVAVMQYINGNWQVVDSSVEDGLVYAQISRFAPVAVVRYTIGAAAKANQEEEDEEDWDEEDESEIEESEKDSKVPANGRRQPIQAAKAVAPKTDDSPAVYFFGGLAVVAAAGVGTVAYKLRRMDGRR